MTAATTCSGSGTTARGSGGGAGGSSLMRLAMTLVVVLVACASGSVVTPAGLPVNSLQQPPTPAPSSVGGPPGGFIPITPSPASPVMEPSTSVASGRQASAPETGNWRLVGKLLLDCSRAGDLVGCLKLKAVTTLGRALASDAAIPIMEDLSLAKDPEAEVRLPEPQSESELEATLPRSLDERSGRLDRLLLERLDAFIRSRTVQFSMPLGLGLFEGRGKGGLGGKKGMGGYLLLLVAGMKAMMMQSAMGGIAMMSGKALIIAKIALLLALLCCLKKGGGEESKAQIVYAAPEHGGGGGWQSGGGGDWNRRSTNDPNNYAQTYAYSAHQRY